PGRATPTRAVCTAGSSPQPREARPGASRAGAGARLSRVRSTAAGVRPGRRSTCGPTPGPVLGPVLGPALGPARSSAGKAPGGRRDAGAGAVSGPGIPGLSRSALRDEGGSCGSARPTYCADRGARGPPLAPAGRVSGPGGKGARVSVSDAVPGAPRAQLGLTGRGGADADRRPLLVGRPVPGFGRPLSDSTEDDCRPAGPATRRPSPGDPVCPVGPATERWASSAGAGGSGPAGGAGSRGGTGAGGGGGWCMDGLPLRSTSLGRGRRGRAPADRRRTGIAPPADALPPT